MARSVTGSSPHHPALCTSCDAEIWFALTTAGHKSMPLNARPDPKGNTACYQDDVGTWHARVLGKDGRAAPHEKLYTPHFATCPKAAEHRRQVRDAQAAIHRGQRNRRGRRPEPEVTGVRIPPPPALPGL